LGKLKGAKSLDFVSADETVKAAEERLRSAEESHRRVASDFAEAKRLERCAGSWSLGELERLKKQVEEEQRDGPVDDGVDRSRVEKEAEQLEKKLDALRQEAQRVRNVIDGNKLESERLTAEFYR
jgi:ABC-type phosphate transport system auxiliary subunit